jgi:hypothetical protein
MRYPLFSRKCADVSRLYNNKLVSLSGILLCCAFIGSLLVACGSNTAAPPAAPASRYGAAPTATLAPTSTPTLVPTPTTPPTPTPQPPTPTPQGAPAVLGLQPSSMSFVGHLDCPGKSAYVCTAKVSSPSSNQSNLHWRTYNTISEQIVFSPASGVLAPGTSVLVKITIPFTACTQGLFFFQGPINTHTITWAC